LPTGTTTCLVDDDDDDDDDRGVGYDDHDDHDDCGEVSSLFLPHADIS